MEGILFSFLAFFSQNASFIKNFKKIKRYIFFNPKMAG